MTPIISIPSEWILVYIVGTLLVTRQSKRADTDLMIFFVISFNLSLTIGLRLYYS